ncbi:MAG: class I SAM-dependent methyltransferase [Gemmatimonadetes bacterium]|nr:class I SAM-dependent methyltransferase [Gemmatimonadota bacterium]MYC93059.1 class I SAM-dependent methyltransferase [Gemmatimonadota bacterium]MYG35304.1 class I SAM-dependent methyltransferase [Gemmatimonadota bacterium]MYJ18678.1 class I SAM-dependent methyltransferase [Gemmatimonadota bacterium]
MRGRGLYVGCGNGRNHVALVDAGLNLTGLDVSREAIAQLRADHPHLTPDLVRADFHDFQSELAFDYIVAIQVFQHGTAAAVRSMFARAAKLLRRGGLLFVRVNSASTDVYYSHRVVERGDRGGFTVRYDDGPKRGLAIRFLSLRELRETLDPWFTPLVPTTEQFASREAPKRGSWAQWEGVWVRR